jgi:hypothetical protein
MVAWRGGDQLRQRLQEILREVGDGGVVRVGFLENAKYPDGKPVAMIALIQDGGAPGAGIPARPFFRNMIAKKQHEWPPAVADLIKANNYNVILALTITGHAIAGQLKQSIIDTNSPPLALSTILRKGFDKPLIETSHMINSVDSEVESGSGT